MTDYQELWNQLQPAEQRFIMFNPQYAFTIKNSRKKAFSETRKRFGHNGRNDISDAFRHCFWAAILCRDLGYETAKEFLTAHEERIGNPVAQKAMDLYHNELGLEVGKLARGTESVDRVRGVQPQPSKPDTWISNYIMSSLLAKGKLKDILHFRNKVKTTTKGSTP